MSSLPECPQAAPYRVEVEEGKNYAWCSCGLSNKQPFCDGSHSGTSFSPVIYTAQESRLVGFCGCKRSKQGAVCDGAHKVL